MDWRLSHSGSFIVDSDTGTIAGAQDIMSHITSLMVKTKELEKKLELYGLIEEHGLDATCWGCKGDNSWVLDCNSERHEAPTLFQALAKFKESLDHD